jgi:RNA-binding protein 39
MSGQKLLGIPVMVQLTEAEKNRLAMQAQNAYVSMVYYHSHISFNQANTILLLLSLSAFGHNDISYHRLYVGSIHFKLTEDELRQIFEPFGPIDSINLHTDETGRSRGFAFIQYVLMDF